MPTCTRKGRRLEDDEDDYAFRPHAPERRETPPKDKDFAAHVPDTVVPTANPKVHDADMAVKRAVADSSSTPLERHIQRDAAEQGRKSPRASSLALSATSAATPKVCNIEPKIGDEEKMGDEELNNSFPGAIAVGGISEGDAQSRSASTFRGSNYEDSFARPRQAREEESMPPIVAECVPSDDEADIEAQVQTRMRNEADELANMVQERIMKNAVVAEVQSEQDTPYHASKPEENEQGKRKKFICIGLIVFIVVVAAVGAALGATLANPEPTPAPVVSSPPASEQSPTSAPQTSPGQCSLCFDGSTPENLEANLIGDDQTCAEFRDGQILLDSSNPDCIFGQAVAWLLCECPSLPPAPEQPTCTLCEGGEDPLGTTGTTCRDLSTFIEHVGGSPLLPCDELVASALEGECACPGGEAPPDVSAIDVFRRILVSLSGDSLDDESSPQFKALTWVSNTDPANTSVGITPIETIKTRYVAAVIYYALGGESWTNQYNFLSEGDVCTWNQNSAGISCNSGGSIITLRLCKYRMVEPSRCYHSKTYLLLFHFLFF